MTHLRDLVLLVSLPPLLRLALCSRELARGAEVRSRARPCASCNREQQRRRRGRGSNDTKNALAVAFFAAALCLGRPAGIRAARLASQARSLLAPSRGRGRARDAPEPLRGRITEKTAAMCRERDSPVARSAFLIGISRGRKRLRFSRGQRGASVSTPSPLCGAGFLSPLLVALSFFLSFETFFLFSRAGRQAEGFPRGQPRALQGRARGKGGEREIFFSFISPLFFFLPSLDFILTEPRLPPQKKKNNYRLTSARSRRPSTTSRPRASRAPPAPRPRRSPFASRTPRRPRQRPGPTSRERPRRPPPAPLTASPRRGRPSRPNRPSPSFSRLRHPASSARARPTCRRTMPSPALRRTPGPSSTRSRPSPPCRPPRLSRPPRRGCTRPWLRSRTRRSRRSRTARTWPPRSTT